MPGMPPAYPPAGMMPYQHDDGPAAKRSRVEEDLVPEGMWLQRVQGAITVNVMTPQSDEWKLDETAVPISLDVTSPVRFYCIA